MRNKGWNRIGIVLSVVWAVFFIGFFAYYLYVNAEDGENPFITKDFVEQNFHIRSLISDYKKNTVPVGVNEEKNVDDLNYEDVVKKRQRLNELRKKYYKNRFGYVPQTIIHVLDIIGIKTAGYKVIAFFFIMLLVPIAFAWSLFYLLVWVVTWVSAGFKE